MKRFHHVRFFIPLFATLVFQDCTDKCKVKNTFTYYTPVYSTSAEIKSAVRYEAPRKLSNLGKIYFKDHYLFINEIGEGIHIIDNREPSSPNPVGFLKIPGNTDLAMINNLLYANSFVDLVVFDATNKTAIKEVNRIERIFDKVQSYGYSIASGNLVLTDWKKQETVSTYESDCDFRVQAWGGAYYDLGIALPFSSGAPTVFSPTSSSSGIGGSIARFTIAQSSLYAIDGNQLDIINLTQPASPVVGKSIEIGWDVETLFPYKDKLFAGSRSGMYIFDVKVQETPVLLSKYEHMRSCDPVVVDDSYAYVTLRNGNTCQGFVNQMEVINITNLSSPQLVKTYPMTNPYGLGIDNKVLFVCDGIEGLKIFDATNVNTIDANQLAHYPGIKAIDIIPFQNVAMMISADGLYQYNYSNPKNIYQVSKLPIIQ